MPKQVDHDGRRRELADAACAVVARDGVDGASLRAVATEAGWSIGSMRHYFSTKTELLVFALYHVGERIESRIAGASPDDGPALHGLRRAVVEMLPLDDVRRAEARVWLAFVARAGIEPELADAARRIWRAINGPLTARLTDAVERGELPPGLDVGAAAVGLQALVDGLVVHLATTPDLVPAEVALTVVDAQLASFGRTAPVDDVRPVLERPGDR